MSSRWPGRPVAGAFSGIPGVIRGLRLAGVCVWVFCVGRGAGGVCVGCWRGRARMARLGLRCRWRPGARRGGVGVGIDMLLENVRDMDE
jgi:hypothetical protein